MLASRPKAASRDAGAWRLREPTEQEFRRFVALVHDASGISLNDTKRALVMRRLSARIQELGLDSIREYMDEVRADASGLELVRLLDLVATNETHFFREPQHFDFLGTRVFPAWAQAADAGKRPRVVRAWSAACSTGQEPYSLAMQMLMHFPPAQGWRLEILGTDLSTKALAVARAAEWAVDRASEIPEDYLRRFMLRGVSERAGRMRATRELRDAVTFSRVNLNDAHYDVPGTFDLIFCRNVLIYFAPEGRAEVIDRLIARLAPDGLLFVGHAESLHAHRDRLRPHLPSVYSRWA